MHYASVWRHILFFIWQSTRESRHFTNTFTSYRCVCTNGELDVDKRSCNPVSNFLFFAKRNEIITLHLDQSKGAAPHQPIKAFSNVIGIDFHYDTQRIFYSDIFTNQIGMIFLNGTGQVVLASSGFTLLFCFKFHLPSYICQLLTMSFICLVIK